MNEVPLAQRLPLLLPKALAWAESTSHQVTTHGQPLAEIDVPLARRVGVLHPELVRIAEVDQMPVPEDAELSAAGHETGLFGPGIVGFTLGYGILLVKGRSTRAILAHELRHVHQFEDAGSIAAFLPKYLMEILIYTYANAPSEIDARNHEQFAADVQ